MEYQIENYVLQNNFVCVRALFLPIKILTKCWCNVYISWNDWNYETMNNFDIQLFDKLLRVALTISQYWLIQDLDKNIFHNSTHWNNGLVSSDWLTWAKSFQRSQLEKWASEISKLIRKRSPCHFQNESIISTLIWYITDVSFMLDRAVSYFWLQCSYPALTHWCPADFYEILYYVFID